MQVVASVQPRDGKPDLKITGTKIGRNADGHAVPIVTVANSSATHGYLSRGRLTIVQRDASGRELIRQTLTGPDIQQGAGYGLIGGNGMRSFTLPLELPAETGTIEARFEPQSRREGQATASAPAPCRVGVGGRQSGRKGRRESGSQYGKMEVVCGSIK